MHLTGQQEQQNQIQNTERSSKFSFPFVALHWFCLFLFKNFYCVIVEVVINNLMAQLRCGHSMDIDAGVKIFSVLVFLPSMIVPNILFTFFDQH